MVHLISLIWVVVGLEKATLLKEAELETEECVAATGSCFSGPGRNLIHIIVFGIRTAGRVSFL